MTILIGIAACQKPEKLIYSNESGMPLTRSITPTVSPLFDWWDTTSVALPGVEVPVTLPWYNGTSTQIPYFLLDDYKPEDGWEMVYNYCINTPPGEVGKYYLIFYNKFTGVLRTFYYNNYDIAIADTTFWSFEVTKPTSLFNAFGPVALPISHRLTSPRVYVTNFTNSPSKSITRGWNCFDVELAYDDQLAQSNAHFNIGLYNMITGTIHLEGELDLNTEGTIVTRLSPTYPGWLGSVAKTIGNGAKDYVSKKLEKTSLKGSISNIISGGISSLTSSGAKFFLGALVGKRNNSYSSSVRLTTTGNVKLEGSLQVFATPNILPLSHNLMPGCVKASDDSFLPSYNEPLGVWNVEELPTLYASTKALWTFSDEYPEYNPNNIYKYHGERVYYFRPEDLKIKINPAVLECLDHYETDIRCIYYARHNNPEQYRPSLKLGGRRNDDTGMKGGTEHLYTETDSAKYIYVLDTQIPNSTVNGTSPWNPYIPSIRGFIYCDDTAWGTLTEEDYNRLNSPGSEMQPFTPDFPFIVAPPYESGGFYKYQVTLTLYPKAPYNETPVISIRTYEVEVNKNGESGYNMPYWDIMRR